MLFRTNAAWLWLAALGIIASLAPSTPQEHLEKHRAQFERESNPVRKAKLLRKLGREEFQAMRKKLGAGNFQEALQVLEGYQGQVRSVKAGLEATGLNPEKKPAGFKQLQISVRESLRQLGDMLLSMPYEQRAPFEAMYKELDEINSNLMRLLFPRRPGNVPRPAKKKS